MRRLSVLPAFAALLLCGCSTHPADRASFHGIRLARAFRAMTVYWAGETVAGLPLTAIDDGFDYDPTIGMRAYYGDCAGHRTTFDTNGCRLPLELTTVIYEPHRSDSLRPFRRVTIRGVPALSFDHGRSLELYTGHVAVDIRAQRPSIALAAASALAPVNTPGSAAAPLPAPQYRPGDPRDMRAKGIATELRAQPSQPDQIAPQLLPGRG